MNTRNTLRLVRVDIVRDTQPAPARRPHPLLIGVLCWWLRLRIRWTQEEIDARAADGSLSAAQHRLWRECITNWRSELQFLQLDK